MIHFYREVLKGKIFSFFLFISFHAEKPGFHLVYCVGLINAAFTANMMPASRRLNQHFVHTRRETQSVM